MQVKFPTHYLYKKIVNNNKYKSIFQNEKNKLTLISSLSFVGSNFV